MRIILNAPARTKREHLVFPLIIGAKAPAKKPNENKDLNR